MARIQPIMPLVWLEPKEHSQAGAPFAPAFLLRVSLEQAKLIRGMLLYLSDPKYWIGTEEQVRAAVAAVELQASEPLLTEAEVCGVQVYGADYRIITEDLLQSLQGEGLPPPPWEFRVVPQVDGSVMLQYRTMEE